MGFTEQLMALPEEERRKRLIEYAKIEKRRELVAKGLIPDIPLGLQCTGYEMEAFWLRREQAERKEAQIKSVQWRPFAVG